MLQKVTKSKVFLSTGDLNNCFFQSETDICWKFCSGGSRWVGISTGFRCCRRLIFRPGPIPEKNPNRGDWEHVISRGIKERTCRNSMNWSKKKWNFQGCSRKTHVEFPWALVFDLGISKGCHTILQTFQGVKAYFLWSFLNVKWQIWKWLGLFQKSISLTTPV